MTETSCSVSSVHAPRCTRAVATFAAVALSLLSALDVGAQDTTRMPVVYKVAGMETVRVEENRVYKRADGADLTLNVAWPSGDTPGGTRPVIVFIHGGPLGRNPQPPPADWGVYRSYGRLAAAHGFVGVTFNFRYYGMERADLERAASDVADAIAHVQQNASRWQADPKRLCLWAFSGGGPMLAAGMNGSITGVRCLVSYYALLDAGPGNTEFSPAVVALPPGRMMPPLFIGRAGLDSPQINASVDAFMARALREGFIVTLATHPTGRHGFDILDDDERSREVIASTFEFARAQTRSAEASPDTRLAQRVTTLYNSLLAADTQQVARLSAPTAWPGDDRLFLDRVASENTVARVGFSLLRSDKPNLGIQLFEWFAREHPRSARANDRLATALEMMGRKEEAKKVTEQTLQLLEQDADLSAETKSALRETATTRLKRLAGSDGPR